MGYPKAGWNTYGNVGNIIIEINVKEASGFKLDRFVCPTDEIYQQILKVIDRKYGFHYPKQKNIPITMTAVQLKADLGIEEKKIST